MTLRLGGFIALMQRVMGSTQPLLRLWRVCSSFGDKLPAKAGLLLSITVISCKFEIAKQMCMLFMKSLSIV